MPTIFPTIHDIQDDPTTHGTSMREIKNAVEQVSGQRTGIVFHYARVFYSDTDPQKNPLFKGGANKILKDGDIWFDRSTPTAIKLKVWDARTQTWQLVP